MKKIYVFSLALVAFVSVTEAQTVIYTENFDADNTNLPVGWTSNPAGSWFIKSSNSSDTYANASGSNNVTIDNSVSPAGTDELISESISTVNYSTIMVDWGARLTSHFMDNGSAISAFSWSADSGNTWNPLIYTENTNNSTWGLDNNGSFLTLPAGAENQASLMFKWTANIVVSSSGTYRIDDFTVMGTSTTGIAQIGDNNGIKAYSYNKAIYVRFETENAGEVKVYSLIGKEVMSKSISQPTEKIDVSELPSGIYLVNVKTNSGKSVTRKVVLN